MRRARKGPRALGRLRKSLNATKRSLWKALLDAARAKRSQSSGAAPEEPINATKRCLWKALLDAARARGPRTLGRLRKSLNATKRSLWKALLDAARAKRSQSSGAAPEESKRLESKRH